MLLSLLSSELSPGSAGAVPWLCSSLVPSVGNFSAHGEHNSGLLLLLVQTGTSGTVEQNLPGSNISSDRRITASNGDFSESDLCSSPST